MCYDVDLNKTSSKVAHKRKEFTDKQKADIYVRDRATCCFSGANLWLLDSPLRPGVQTDWVDHVLPSASGGGNGIDNGVCASHTYNAKKRNNTADTFYLFEHGLPTSGYFDVFGVIAPEQVARLQRLSCLAVEDWFFNRAMTWIIEGLNDRCSREFYDSNYVRDADYWFGAAYRKILSYQKIARADSLEDRGIVEHPDEIAQQWLALRYVESRDALVDVADELFSIYRDNYIAWGSYFWDSESPSELTNAYSKAMESERISSDVRDCIECDYHLKQSRGEQNATEQPATSLQSKS